MSASHEKVIATLNFLELTPDVGTFEGRFLTQKVAFIAQTLGLPTNYRFTPYLNGPYSPALTKDYYCNASQFSSRKTNYELNEEQITQFTKFKRCQDLFEVSKIPLMESTSTIIYYLNHTLTNSEQAVLALVKSIKPYLTEDELLLGIARAKEILFRPEYLTRQLRREIDNWNKIDLNIKISC